MEDHIKRYKQISEKGYYVPPRIENTKNEQNKFLDDVAVSNMNGPKIEIFDVDDSRAKKNQNNNIEFSPKIEDQNQNISFNENNNNNNGLEANKGKEILDNIKQSYQKIINNKTVSYIINPFQDDSRAIQLCYKIYSGVTIFIIFLVIVLSICFA